eukprot:CAMPEP_0184869460 /NCGR_PEP_ID=MMETSP0580-20130426/34138_1 /TAXON_ID=1118495 /ORGANISM="Dactyliosolen fragilissimus" /LENGTH=454 /DNA_ID=CAMNT_0027370951 /DNA_START=252 /DNA_END=1616 /DNA_ORIENTATION=+
MQCRHFLHCHQIPTEVKNKLNDFKRGECNQFNTERVGGGSIGQQQYWIESAQKLGLVDSLDGIQLSRDKAYFSKSIIRSTDSTYYSSTTLEEDSIEASDNQFDHRRPYGKTVVDERKVTSYKYFKSVDEYNSYHSATPIMSRSKDTSAPSKPIISPDFNGSMPFLKGEDSFETPLQLSVFEELMGKTSLVSISDKDLVPDYLFLAMAQMKTCALAESDRVGCYKSRDIGFTGMCCKHCGGQPGFGKYFPATVRSLAQTTTSQTIVKHIASKCRACPLNVRDVINTLLEKQNEKDRINKIGNSSGDGRPRYGSRKVFFQRVWGRLHNEDIPEIPQHEDCHRSKYSMQQESEKKDCTKRVIHDGSLISPNESDGVDEIDSESTHSSDSNSFEDSDDSQYDDQRSHDENMFIKRKKRRTTYSLKNATKREGALMKNLSQQSTPHNSTNHKKSRLLYS